MFTAVAKAFQEALHNLRANFFQTILSVLGIIIGVGALVAMLSLIDGLEAFAQERIASKTSIETVMVRANTHREIDEVRVRRDTVAQLNLDEMNAILDALPYEAEGQLFSMGTKVLHHPKTDSMIGIRYVAASLPLRDDEEVKIRFGRLLDQEDQYRPVTLVNAGLAGRLLGNSSDTSSLIGTSFALFDEEVEIVGVTRSEDPTLANSLAAIFPIALFEQAGEGGNPNLMLNFTNVEEVTAGKAFLETWAAERYAGIDDPVSISSQDSWLEELQKGFLVFRLVMGLLVGIAVVVGGVGVMNVLLMSINERTAEIGIRKAVGADRGNILAQFLAESVAISTIGSVFGILLGILVAMGAAPLLSMVQPELEFRAVLTLQTILTVGIIAVLVGVIFGTYPARKAARLDPVVAIQRT